MRAVRLYGVGDLRHEADVRCADLAPTQVRVRVRAAGVCGSDLHNFRTGQWMSRLPIIPGHEFSGEVHGVGEAVVGLRPRGLRDWGLAGASTRGAGRPS